MYEDVLGFMTGFRRKLSMSVVTPVNQAVDERVLHLKVLNLLVNVYMFQLSEPRAFLFHVVSDIHIKSWFQLPNIRDSELKVKHKQKI